MKTLKTNLLRLIKSRRSIRKYRKNPVPLEKIYQILEAGRYAPSGANLQPWIYIVVTDNKLKEKIREGAEKIEIDFHKKAPKQFKRWLKEQKITPEKSFLTEAPALIVVAGFTKAPYWLESTWVSIAYILLSVESQNLGTLTYTPPETVFLSKLLNIPEAYHPVAILPIGYSAETPSPETRPRRPREQIVYLNIYHNKSNTSRAH
jgi:nitroreductase